MAPPDDDNVGGGQGGAAGNAGGNGGNAVVDRLKSLELGGLSTYDPKGDPTTLCARWKRWKRAFNLYVKSRCVSDERQKVALMLHTGGMALQEVFYSLAEEDADLSLAETLKFLTNILSLRLTSHSNLLFKLTKRLTNSYVGCDRNRCHVTLRK